MSSPWLWNREGREEHTKKRQNSFAQLTLSTQAKDDVCPDGVTGLMAESLISNSTVIPRIHPHIFPNLWWLALQKLFLSTSKQYQLSSAYQLLFHTRLLAQKKGEWDVKWQKAYSSEHHGSGTCLPWKSGSGCGAAASGWQALPAWVTLRVRG